MYGPVPEMSFSCHAEGEKNQRRASARLSAQWRDLVARPRLLNFLAEVRASRITIVQAPAGYGKSSLLLQWHDALAGEGALVIAVQLEAIHREPMEFARHLARLWQANFSCLSPVFALSGHDTRATAEQLACQMAAALSDPPAPVFLLLDDAQLLAGTDSIRFLHSLVEHVPPLLHIVVASRERLALPMARWRARGELAEITLADLRFSADETHALLAKAGLDDLSADEIRALDERVEGWAAGLRIALPILSSADDHSEGLKSISGERRELRDFFAEDLFAGQPAQAQQTLLRISLLQKFCAPLCEAITGLPNGRRVLDWCENAGLFVIALDDTRTWYRFHRLFQEFLVRTFADQHAEDSDKLHRRATDWHIAQGMVTDAFEHALAGNDPNRAAGVLDEHLDRLFGAGQAHLVPVLAARVPPHIRTFYPRIMLAAAWPLSMHWEFAEAQTLLAASRSRIADMERQSAAAKSDIQAIRLQLAHGEMMLAQFQDDMPTVEQLGITQMRNCQAARPFVAGSIYSAFLNSQREQFKLNDVDRLDFTATRYLDQCEGRQVHIAHEAVAGLTRFLMGDSGGAIERLRNGLAITTRIFGDKTPLCAMTALPLAAVLYERNAVKDADALIETFLPLADTLGFVDQLIDGWLTRSRILRLRGDPDTALQALSSAGAIAAKRGFARLALHCAEERARQLLRSGRSDEAARAARPACMNLTLEAVLPTGAITSSDEIVAMMWATWAECKNRLPDALQVCRQWRSYAAAAGAIRSVIRWDARIAHLALQTGDLRSAKRTMRRAVALAAPGRYMRSFLDEPALAATLQAHAPGGMERNGAAETFAADLVREFTLEGAKDPTGPDVDEPDRSYPRGALNSHELEVLKLTATGLSNREVGEHLGMTEGSVKWDLQQIYNKMGVRRRILVVERARQLGLIH